MVNKKVFEAWADFEWEKARPQTTRGKANDRLWNEFKRQYEELMDEIPGLIEDIKEAEGRIETLEAAIGWDSTTDEPPRVKSESDYANQVELLHAYNSLAGAIERYGELRPHQKLIKDWVTPRHVEAENRQAAVKTSVNEHRQDLLLTTAGPRAVGWVGGWGLGSGAFGQTGVWVRQNTSGVVNDRIVIKDTYFDQSSSSQQMWDDETLWVTDERTNLRVPVEAQAMIEVRDRPGSEYIVRLLNWALDEDRKMYRLYMELCPYGELWAIVHRDGDTPKPEPFLWHLFECLAIAGRLMCQGGDKYVEGWKTIVHRDCKVANVFMAQADEDRYCRYPTPKVGDFGLAVFVDEGEEQDIASYGCKGTPDNCAPEHTEHNLYLSEGEIQPLSSKTNVWGIGNLIGSVVWATEGYPGLVYSDGRQEPDFNKDESKSYSKELRKLILDCMQYDASKRPSFRSILKRIQAGKEKHGQGLEYEPVDGERWDGYELKMAFTDQWPVGELLSDAKSLPQGREFPVAPDVDDLTADQGGELIEDDDAKIDFSRYHYDAAEENAEEGDGDEDVTMEDAEPEQTPATTKKASPSARSGAMDRVSQSEDESRPTTRYNRKRKVSEDEDDEYVEKPKGRARRRR